MCSDSTLVDVSEGAVKGVLSFSEEKIKEVIEKFKNHELNFIEDQETIDLVKEQLKTGEWSFYKEHVKDKKLRVLIQMGLALRRLEKDPEKLQNLRDNIIFGFGEDGLHISQFVQNKILSKYLGTVVSEINSEQDLIGALEDLLKNIDKFVIFIKTNDNIERSTKKIITRIDANAPKIFILGSRKSAIDNCNKIKENLKKEITDYKFTINEDEEKLILFLLRKEQSE
jgi:hypothetical protein